jgi:hypothetical protein
LDRAKSSAQELLGPIDEFSALLSELLEGAETCEKFYQSQVEEIETLQEKEVAFNRDFRPMQI